MEFKFHPISTECDECKTQMSILRLRFRADSIILVDLVCNKCGRTCEWTIAVSDAIQSCIDMDISQVLKEQGIKVLPELSEVDDTKFLKELGISMDGG